MEFFVYILKSKNYERFYIGQTRDVLKRLAEHNRGIVRSTKAYRPWRVYEVEVFRSRTEAIRREHFLKSPSGWKELKEKKERGCGFPEGIPSGQIPPFRHIDASHCGGIFVSTQAGLNEELFPP